RSPACGPMPCSSTTRGSDPPGTARPSSSPPSRPSTEWPSSSPPRERAKKEETLPATRGGLGANKKKPSPLCGEGWEGIKRKLLAPTYRLEAVEAVHRTAPRRHKRNLGRLAAVRADHVMQDARAAVAVGRPAGGAALGAAPGLVLKPPRLVELLLPSREQELATTVATRQRAIHESYRHRTRPPRNSRFPLRGHRRISPVYPLELVGRDNSAPDNNLETGLNLGLPRFSGRDGLPILLVDRRCLAESAPRRRRRDRNLLHEHGRDQGHDEDRAREQVDVVQGVRQRPPDGRDNRRR